MHLSSSSEKIFVAGHRGLVGSGVVRALKQVGFTNIVTRSRSELDLLNQASVNAFFEREQPEFVVLAAAKVGGILANDTYPADFLAQNLSIQSNVIEAAFRAGVKRLVFLGSTCIYPKLAQQPLKEEYLLTGPLEPTNEWYAIAKIAGVKLCESLRKQYGVDFISLMPTNMYGPGDNFDLNSSHVLPAMMRNFHAAKGTSNSVELWGTGTPKREFLYVDDLSSAVIHVLKTEEGPLHAAAPGGLMNVGVGQDLAISELAKAVKRAVGSTNEIVYDATKPDGTPRKLVDVSRLFSLGWKPEVSLEDGLSRTYEWYLKNVDNLDE